MNNNYGTGAKYLTQRDTNAPSLDSVFSQFGQSSQRTDCPQWIEPYSILPCTDPATCSNAIPYSDGTLKPWTPHPGIESAPPVIYINELLDIYTRPLPGHADTGKKVTRKFITNADVSQYMNERKQAAALYYQTQKK